MSDSVGEAVISSCRGGSGNLPRVTSLALVESGGEGSSGQARLQPGLCDTARTGDRANQSGRDESETSDQKGIVCNASSPNGRRRRNPRVVLRGEAGCDVEYRVSGLCLIAAS